MARLSLLTPLLYVTVLAGCGADSSHPAGLRPSTASSNVAAADGEGSGPSVTGHAENTFVGGQLLRNVSFSARQLPDGSVSGRFHVTLQGPGRFTGYPDEGTQPITFEVTCLDVEGNRAWIGGRIVAPKTDPYLGLGDVWYVVDGGDSAPDRVGVAIGYNPESCHNRPAIYASPSERGELTVRDAQ
ncbi:MAG TPA: hypothetical protein VFN38_11350 [Gemmatimonadaceae bacterium]|nr:hypothetical protein [Gemmatimonadaceae bacterium]